MLSDVIGLIVNWVVLPALIVFVIWKVISKLIVIFKPEPLKEEKEYEEEMVTIYDLDDKTMKVEV